MDQKQRTILSLNANCFDFIFDYFSIKDLCAVGKSCKHLQNVAGEYFRRMYPSKSIDFSQTTEGHIVQRVDGFDTNFAQYAQQLDFFNNNIDIYRYAAANGSKSLKSIQFDVKSLSLCHSDCLANIMKTVENVTFFRCFENAETFHDLLQHCSNLMCLTLYNWPVTKYDWPSQKYAKLDCLEVFGTFTGKYEGLIHFLQLNQHIKKLRTSVGLVQALDIVESANIKLDELSFIVNGIDKMKTNAFRDRVNRMCERKYFMELRMFCYWGNEFIFYIDDIKNVQGLSSVEIAYRQDNMKSLVSALITLEHLKELLFFYCSISREQAHILSQYLVNIEKIHLGCDHFGTAIPFVYNSSKLKTLEIGEQYFDEHLSLRQLNVERGKLTEAVQVTIFVPEETFLNIKWKFQVIRFRWIQFKRASWVYPIR